jgi:very-short-patch-repair endonuclease
MSYGYETAAPDRYELLKDFAKHNRREMTEGETVLWNALRKELKGHRFRRQHPIGDYIVDFICLSEKLVIEVDGGYHETPEQQYEDQLRTEFLQKKEYRVIRFKNEDVIFNTKETIKRIKEIITNTGSNYEQ